MATLPVYRNALEGKGVHVVTVNDYLARRDAEWMGEVYSFLGLTTGVIVPNLNEMQRREAYNSDITYAPKPGRPWRAPWPRRRCRRSSRSPPRRDCTGARSDERRVGKGCVSRCRYRGS